MSDKPDKSILVTGGCGFIGSHLVDRLLDEGEFVVCIDNMNNFYDPAIKRLNQKSHLESGQYSFFEGDIRDRDFVASIFQEHRFGSVYHLAAMAGVRPSVENPHLYMDVNIMGTQVILDLAKDHSVGHFIFASSSSIYGNNDKIPFSEDDHVENQISPYGASKRMGELLCRTYNQLYSFPITCLRFFTVYGPRQRPEMAIHSFVRSIFRGEKLTLYGDGSMARDYTYIDDIIDGILKAGNPPDNFMIYNLGNSEPVKLADMVEVIAAATKSEPTIAYAEIPKGDVIQTFADISRAGKRIDYHPKISLGDGINKFVGWFNDMVNQHGDLYR